MNLRLNDYHLELKGAKNKLLHLRCLTLGCIQTPMHCYDQNNIIYLQCIIVLHVSRKYCLCMLAKLIRFYTRRRIGDKFKLAP